MRCVVVGFAMMLGLASSPAAAQVVEFTDGPAANSNRVVGLGGAFVGVAEGADGQRVNPAAFGTRYAFTRNDYFDWDFTFYSLAVPRGGSIDLSGRPGDVDGASMVGFGLDLKLGIFGFGFHIFGKNYDVVVENESQGVATERTYSYGNAKGTFGFSWALPWIDTTIGLAPTVVDFSISDAQGNVLAQTSGGGLQIGAIWRPTNRRFRLGASYQSAILGFGTTIEPPEDFVAETPAGLVAPAELRIGGSWMFGARPYNPPRHFGHPEHFGEGGPDTLPRPYVLLSAEAVVTGATVDAVGAQSYAAGEPLPSGERATIGLHYGAEWEFWPDWMRVRGGYYWEPSRIASIDGRHHLTFGADLKVPVFWDFKLQVVFDGARDYLNAGLGLGLWY